MGSVDRVSIEVALERLHQFEQLSDIITDQWLTNQIEKCVSQYSLITGWLTTSPDDWNRIFIKNTQALDDALMTLKDTVSTDIWNKLSKKVRAKSGRAESKSTLAELSLAIFLVSHNLSFAMETKLISQKDVDFSIKSENLGDVHIEMHSLAESEASQKTSQLSANLGGLPVSIDFNHEDKRILGKINSKTPKLVEDKITLVALDCTAIPEHGGIELGTIYDVLLRVFGQDDLELTESEKEIRRLVDGVIWFESDLPKALYPVRRGYLLNEHSQHRCATSLQRWINLWSGEE